MEEWIPRLLRFLDGKRKESQRQVGFGGPFGDTAVGGL